MNDEIQLILFDMMDTLLADPFFPVLRKMCADQKQIREWSETRTKGVFEKFEKGLITEYEYFRDFYSTSNHSWWRPEKIKKYMFQSIDFLPGMKALFEDCLASQTATGIASNYSSWYQDVIRLRPEIEKADYLFFSCELGERKPSAEFFHKITESLNMQPGKILFIDDRIENIKAARSQGWQTFHFHREGDGLADFLRAKIF